MITYGMGTPPEISNFNEFDFNSEYYKLGIGIYYLIFKTYPYVIKLNNNNIKLKITKM